MFLYIIERILLPVTKVIGYKYVFTVTIRLRLDLRIDFERQSNGRWIVSKCGWTYSNRIRNRSRIAVVSTHHFRHDRRMWLKGNLNSYNIYYIVIEIVSGRQFNWDLLLISQWMNEWMNEWMKFKLSETETSVNASHLVHFQVKQHTLHFSKYFIATLPHI